MLWTKKFVFIAQIFKRANILKVSFWVEKNKKKKTNHKLLNNAMLTL